MRARTTLALSLLLVAASCDGGSSTLTVLMRTDLVAGAQFDRVEVRLWPLADVDDVVSLSAPLAGIPVELRRLDAEAVLAGEREVARFENLAPGRYAGEIALRSGDPLLVRNRFVITVLAGPLTLPVSVDASCVDVECPSAGSPAGFVACRAGQCVDPRCVADPMGTLCGDALVRCSEDEGCASLVACAAPVCEDGYCSTRPRADACEAGLYCNVLEGCVPVPPPGSHRRCDTICDVEGDPCAIGRVTCVGGTYACEPVATKVTGAPCEGGACDASGACVAD